MTSKDTSGFTCRWGWVKGFMGRRAFKRRQLVCVCGKFIMGCQLFSYSPAAWHGFSIWIGSFCFLTDTNRMRLCSLAGARLTPWQPGGAAGTKPPEPPPRGASPGPRRGFAGAPPAVDLFLFLKEVIYCRLLARDPNLRAQTKQSNLAKPN